MNSAVQSCRTQNCFWSRELGHIRVHIRDTCAGCPWRGVAGGSCMGSVSRDRLFQLAPAYPSQEVTGPSVGYPSENIFKKGKKGWKSRGVRKVRIGSVSTKERAG